MSNGTQDEKPEKICTCYCLAAWIGPTAASDVPDPAPNPTETTSLLPPSVTETTTGMTFWNATVNTKTYGCDSKNVSSSIASTEFLFHNRYTDTRTAPRTFKLTTFTIPAKTYTFTINLGLFSTTVSVTVGPTSVRVPVLTPGTWGPTTRTVGPTVSDQQALAASGLIPWCPDDHVACP